MQLFIKQDYIHCVLPRAEKLSNNNNNDYLDNQQTRLFFSSSHSPPIDRHASTFFRSGKYP